MILFQSPLDRVLRVLVFGARNKASVGFNPLLIGSSEFYATVQGDARVSGKFQSPLDRVLRVLQENAKRAFQARFNPLLIGSSEF